MIGYTDAQRAAIDTRGAPILVSAGAGSGKTSVLVERLMRYISEGDNPPGLDSFLIITYTRAAAAELRGRIAKALSRLIAENPHSRHLRRQAALVYQARIETIHKFCGEVLRAGAQNSPLGSEYSIIDDIRADAIKRRVFGRLAEELYSDMDGIPGFCELVDTVGAGRDDSGLELLVYSLHAKVTSHPYPEEWLGELLEKLESKLPADISETVFGRGALLEAKKTAEYWERRLSALYSEIEASPEGAGVLINYGDQILTACASLRDFARACGEGWDSATRFHEIRFDTLGRKKLLEGHALRDYAKSVIDKCKKKISAQFRIFRSGSRELLREEEISRPALRALYSLMLRFERALREEMARLTLADFSDLEHHALGLLVDRVTGEPTELAVRFSESFTEVMVDEYQDVSKVQDLIMRAISGGGRRLFMVGDVKQSIYRFRLADPSLFLEKYEHFARREDASEGEARKILMNENFRSRDCVINAVNSVFERLMTRGLGELDYGEDEMLSRKAPYPENSDESTELVLIDVPPASVGESISVKKLEAEAEYIAGRIREMMDVGYLVYADGAYRPLSYSDIAVLMRSPAKAVRVFRRVFEARGIPLRDSGEAEFLRSEEIVTALSVLSVIRNPRDDIELVSALRSPVFALGPDELADIRAADPGADIYGALEAEARENTKCADFFRVLGRLRLLAEQLPLAELVWKMFEETDMPTIFSAMPDGAGRRANLWRLFELAVDFEADGYRGVGAFLSELRGLAASGKEPRGAAADVRDGVALMSVHKSKGLEYPIVFLAGTSKPFNKTDFDKSVLCHPELGMGMLYTDFEKGVRYPSLAHQMIKASLLREGLSEELRILYVAMTRAREKLIIMYSEKNAAAEIEKLAHTAGAPPDAEELMDMSCSGKWLISAALGGASLELKTVLSKERRRIEESQSGHAAAEEPAEISVFDLRERLEYRYPHEGSALLPSKLTATGIEKEPTEEYDDAAVLAQEPREPVFRLPDFTGIAKAPTGAERGIATHLVMQHIDFSRTGSVREIRLEISRLADSSFLTREQAEIVSEHSVFRFFSGEMGRRVLSAREILREFRFSLLIRAADIYENGGDDEILLQGVVDLCLEEDGKLTIVDFKTDYVTTETVPEKLEFYGPQLRIYAHAMSRITGKPVSQAAVCFLRTGETAFLEL